MNYLGDTGDSIKSVVVDDDRRKEAIDTVKSMKKRTKGHDKVFGKLIKELKSELQDHGGDESALEHMWEQRLELTNEYNADMVNMRFELKDQLTREEWAHVFGEK